MRLIYHNLIGVFAIALGSYFLLNNHKFLTIIVCAMGLTVVLYGMKKDIQKVSVQKVKRKKK